MYNMPTQEEDQIKFFNQAMNLINSEIPCLIELGSGGTDASYYSIIFEQKFPNSFIINTEPRLWLLENVKILWKNTFLSKAVLYHCYQGEILCPEYNIDTSTPKKELSEIIIENNLTRIDILHIDIQGAEVHVLHDLLENNFLDIIRFYFINIHNINGRSTMQECKQVLSKLKKYKIYFEDSSCGGFGDGLLIIENLKENNEN